MKTQQKKRKIPTEQCISCKDNVRIDQIAQYVNGHPFCFGCLVTAKKGFTVPKEE